MNDIERFCNDNLNIEDIKTRSYKFAQECEMRLKEFQTHPLITAKDDVV